MAGTTYDVIVLGVGAMGSAAIYQLAKRGLSVLGVDQFSPPHTQGSSFGESRIIRKAIGEGRHYVPLVLRSYEIWDEIEKASGRRLLETTGGLIISSAKHGYGEHSPEFFKTTIEAANKFHIGHMILDAKAIREKFPQFFVADDEQGYYEPDAGFLRPENCIAAQIDLARKRGATIFINEKVLEFKARSGGVLIRTEHAEYQGDKLVVTVGPWLAGLLGGNAQSVFKVYRQVLFWFDAAAHSDSFMPGRFPIFIWELQKKAASIYRFPIAQAGGGVKVATEQYEATTNPDDMQRAVSIAEIDYMFEEFIAPCFPGISRKSRGAAACAYTVTEDAEFVIDWHPEYRNVIVASPCSGHGFKHSAAIGEAIAEMVVEGSTQIDISKFNISRLGLAL